MEFAREPLSCRRLPPPPDGVPDPAELARLRDAAELRALKARLQPHFLLNSLNSLSALIRSQPERAERVLCRLGDLLRLCVEQSAAQEVTLAEEVAFTAAYVEVERARHGERFHFVLDVDPRTEACIVPHLVVQPLVENAIRHGFAPPGRGGRILVRSRRAADGRLLLGVQDDGVGLPDGWSSDRAGVGLGTTLQRLQRLFGPAHTFRLSSAPGGGTLAELGLPFRTAGRA
jgi:two-component system, LytTR family, sensor kinase